jgi:hypothetical protein
MKKFIPGFGCGLFPCMVMSWLRRFATGYKEPGYMGESFADSTGASFWKENAYDLCRN